jgi:hypothetical protein
MLKRRNGRIPAVAAAGVAALLVGIGFGLFLFRGPERSTSGPPDTSEPMPACTDQTPMALLNGSTIPESEAAIASALANATALYFTCQSLPFGQFSRVFATLSVVIAQYAPDPQCFKDDRESLSTRWEDQHASAERLGRSELLVASLRRKIGNVLGCLPGDDRRLFYVDFAHAFTYAAGAHAMQTFVNPQFRGQRLDRCLYYGRDCNEPVARAWCEQYGYSRIAKWEWVNVPHTITLGDRKACDGACGAFTTIVCAQ